MSNPSDKRFRRALPFFVEFVKFGSVFAVLVIAGLLALRFTSGAWGSLRQDAASGTLQSVRTEDRKLPLGA